MKQLLREFLIHYKALIIVIGLFPIVPIGVYILFYKIENPGDFWLTIISCLISYVGSIGWGMFIFYESWRRDKREEIRNMPKISFSYMNDVVRINEQSIAHECFFSYDRVKKIIKSGFIGIVLYGDVHLEDSGCGYMGLRITNLGTHLIYLRGVQKVYVVNGESNHRSGLEVMEQTEMVYYESKRETNTLSYRDTVDYYIGVDKILVDTSQLVNRDVYFQISVEDEFYTVYNYLVRINYNRGSMLKGVGQKLNDKQLRLLKSNPEAFFAMNIV